MLQFEKCNSVSFQFFILFSSSQVPIEYLQPQQETLMHIGDFTLYYRTLPLRFKIEKQHSYDGKSFVLKCEAIFDRYTDLTRAKTVKIFIVSTDDLTNQKLVNSKNAATSITGK